MGWWMVGVGRVGGWLGWVELVVGWGGLVNGWGG